MKQFLIYEFLLPTCLCALLIMPLVAVHSCVTMGRDGTYTVDGYGDCRRATKDEMEGFDANRGGGVNPTESIKLIPGQFRAQH